MLVMLLVLTYNRKTDVYNDVPKTWEQKNFVFCNSSVQNKTTAQLI